MLSSATKAKCSKVNSEAKLQCVSFTSSRFLLSRVAWPKKVVYFLLLIVNNPENLVILEVCMRELKKTISNLMYAIVFIFYFYGSLI